MIIEGARVTYVGTDGRAERQEGTVIAVTATSPSSVCHVQWATGAFEALYEDDLSDVDGRTQHAHSASLHDPLADSLEVGSLQTYSVRTVLDEGGEAALLNEMIRAGHLAGLGPVVDEAIALVAARLRQSLPFIEVTAQLDPEEADSLVSLASTCLVRDAFASLDEDD